MSKRCVCWVQGDVRKVFNGEKYLKLIEPKVIKVAILKMLESI